jgi:predicted Zn-dependent peptidase
MRGLRGLVLATVLLALPATADAQKLTVPVAYHKLENGLKVVLSEDHSAPTAVVAVYYGIGFRIEPRERTGSRTCSST